MAVLFIFVLFLNFESLILSGHISELYSIFLTDIFCLAFTCVMSPSPTLAGHLMLSSSSTSFSQQSQVRVRNRFLSSQGPQEPQLSGSPTVVNNMRGNIRLVKQYTVRRYENQTCTCLKIIRPCRIDSFTFTATLLR